MTNLNQKTSGTQSNSKPVANNAFARALLESEKNGGDAYASAPKSQGNNPFAEALSKTGGQFSQDQSGEFDFAKQQAEMIAAQKKEALRKKLHDQVNPVDTHEIFAAYAKKNLEELQAVRQELKLLVEEVRDLDREVDLAVTRDVVDPGIDATGFFNFFHKLREFIMLLREQVHSARSWMNQTAGKGKRGRGTAFNFKKTKDVHGAMGSEHNFGMNMGA